LFEDEMLKVGLTGSIGVGKSFVARILEERGCYVIDADVTAREVVLPGTQGLAAVVQAFGAEVLQQDGTLDRKRVASVVFADEDRRQLLNSILHPCIIERQDELIREWEHSNPNGIAVVDAALMIESGGYRRFDKLIVVHCDPEIQLERVMARGGLTREDAQKRIASQMPQEEKLRFADFAIDTSEGFESTQQRTEVVLEQLQTLAASNESETGA
jgi:dephospho-CoA kinase